MRQLSLLALLGAISICIQAQVTNLRFFGLWFGAADDSNIIMFQSTFIIPAGSPDGSVDNEVQAFWPGVQGAGLLQNVITNGGSPGTWWQLPFYCCNPGTNISNEVQVYPGDRVTNTFALNEDTMLWHDSYMITPSISSNAVDQNILADGFIFNQSEVATDNSTFGDRFTTNFMTIELQGNGIWDFGPVLWRDILLRINTTDTTWCTTGPTLSGGTDFNYTYSEPVATSVDGTTSCYIAEMNFWSPYNSTQ